MTHEYDQVRASFASSGPGRLVVAGRLVAESGWRSSLFRRGMRRLVDGMTPASRTVLIKMVAVAIAVAAGLQPLLMWLMPPTIRPAMPPYIFVAIAVIAGVAAWRSEQVATASPSSRLIRWLRG